jgi:hypothetical protein
MTPHRSIKSFLATVAAVGLALPALAAVNTEAHKEIATAAQHAGFAAKARNVKLLHTHLHHVINCLAGSSGSGFDAAAGNPCNGEGKGALADASGAEATEALLNQSLRLARIGVEINDRNAARAVAIATHDLLRLAERDKTAKTK